MSDEQRRRDSAASALVCGVLAVAAVVLWSLGNGARAEAAAFSVAPVCPAAGECRTVTATTVADRYADSAGRTRMIFADGSNVILDAGIADTAVPGPGVAVTLVRWHGAIAEVDSPAGDDSTINSPMVAASANTELTSVVLAVMFLVALIAMQDQLRAVARRVVPRRARRGADAVAADPAPPELPAAVGAPPASFAVSSTVIGGKSTQPPSAIVASTGSAPSYSISPIRSSSGSPLAVGAQKPQPGTPVVSGDLAFAEVSVPSHEPPLSAHDSSAGGRPGAPNGAGATVGGGAASSGISLNPVGSPVPGGGAPAGLPLNPVGSPVPGGVPPAGLPLNPVGSPVPGGVPPAGLPLNPVGSPVPGAVPPAIVTPRPLPDTGVALNPVSPPAVPQASVPPAQAPTLSQVTQPHTQEEPPAQNS